MITPGVPILMPLMERVKPFMPCARCGYSLPAHLWLSASCTEYLAPAFIVRLANAPDPWAPFQGPRGPIRVCR